MPRPARGTDPPAVEHSAECCCPAVLITALGAPAVTITCCPAVTTIEKDGHVRFVPLRLNKFMAEDELDAAKHKCPTCDIMYDMNERWVHGACEVRRVPLQLAGQAHSWPCHICKAMVPHERALGAWACKIEGGPLPAGWAGGQCCLCPICKAIKALEQALGAWAQTGGPALLPRLNFAGNICKGTNAPSV